MEENRFLRTYQEHKREKELERQSRLPEYNSRFECLRNNISPQINSNTINKFSCLIDDDYKSISTKSSSSSRNTTYLPKSEPRESVNTKMRRLREEKKSLELTKPTLSLENIYHFPELNRVDIPIKVEKPIINLSEQPQNENIIPTKKKIMTILSIEKGKLVPKDVYEDNIIDTQNNIIVDKKPQYNSWASVLKYNN